MTATGKGKCLCGSGEILQEVLDGRGMFVDWGCNQCRQDKLQRYQDRCSCGSGRYPLDIYNDRHDIIIATGCVMCREKKIKEYYNKGGKLEERKKTRNRVGVDGWIYILGYFGYIGLAAWFAWGQMSLYQYWTYVAFQAVYGTFWPFFAFRLLFPTVTSYIGIDLTILLVVFCVVGVLLSTWIFIKLRTDKE